ncbi:MAG TPA: hypothetical protein VGE42_05280 [Candidatus Dormibacteraeota bacterium]
MHPGVRIAADAVVLERWRAEDATALLAAVSESVDHLRPWMDWATERPTLASMDGFISRSTEGFDAGASAGVARRLGFRLDRVDDNAVRAPAETGRAMIWVLERDQPPAAG